MLAERKAGKGKIQRAGKDKGKRQWQSRQKGPVSHYLFPSWRWDACWWVANFAGGEQCSDQDEEQHRITSWRDTAFQKLAGSSWSTYIFSTYIWAFGTVPAIPELYHCDLWSLDKTHCQHQDYRKSNQSMKRFHLKSMSPLKMMKKEGKIRRAEVVFLLNDVWPFNISGPRLLMGI